MANNIEKHRQVTFQAIEQVQQLAALFTKRRNQLAQQVGLTEAQWRILEGISTEHFMPSMFAREQDNTCGAVSKIIRQLLEKKLIKVSISEKDGRKRQYELLPQGKKTMSQLRELREEAIQEIWADLPMDDLEIFTRFSGLLIEKWRQYSTTS